MTFLNSKKQMTPCFFCHAQFLFSLPLASMNWQNYMLSMQSLTYLVIVTFDSVRDLSPSHDLSGSKGLSSSQGLLGFQNHVSSSATQGKGVGGGGWVLNQYLGLSELLRV